MIKNDPQKGQKRGKKVLFLLAFLQEKREPSMYYWTTIENRGVRRHTMPVGKTLLKSKKSENSCRKRVILATFRAKNTFSRPGIVKKVVFCP